MSVDFRITIKQLAPSWLLGPIGTKFLDTFGTVFNSLYSTIHDGVMARFPSYAPDDALGYLAPDKNLEQGDAEPNDNFRARLITAVDENKVRGSAHALLEQLAAYFDGLGNPPIRLVSQVSGGTWHEYNYLTKVTTKTIVGNNWDWDGNPTRYWWGWIIIDSSSGPWTAGLVCGDPSGGEFGDGAVCGISATLQQVQKLQRFAQNWKRAKVHISRIIVTFDNTLYLRTNAKPPNPNGEMGDPVNFSSNAAYLLSGGEEP